MKKFIFFLIIFTLLYIRPAFSQTIVDEKSGRLLWNSDVNNTIQFSDENYGLIHEDNIILSESVPYRAEEKSSFPEQFDARSKGWITPVKNQKPFDLCWAESVMSMAESNMIKKGMADAGIDLSEIFAHYFQWNRVPDPLGLTIGDENIWNAYESYPGYIREWINSWGSGYRAVLLLSGWPGITTEDVAPYPSGDTDVTNYYLDPSLAWNSSFAKLQDAWWIPTEDTQAIKRLIMKYGSAVIAFYQNREQYLNEETGAYYSPDSRYSNHLVNVIGWDDNYPACNFSSSPEHNGAWLVKNSFGTEWGNDGYFWLSYDDKTYSGDAFIFDFQPIESDVKMYQYDGSVNYNYLSDPNSNVFAAANVFTAIDNERLISVGFVTPSSYYSYKIEIYRGVKDKPDSGILFSHQNGEELYAGYHTIMLDKPVELTAGDRFSVIIEITAKTPGTAYIMTDRSESFTVKDANDKEIIYQEFISASHPGESFYRAADGSWIDCWDAEPSRNLGNVRIMANTKFISYSSIKSTDTDEIITFSDAPLTLFRIEPSDPGFTVLDFPQR